MGFNVTMIENSPVMSLLLNDALKKLKLLNFNMYHGNSYDYLNHSEKSLSMAQAYADGVNKFARDNPKK